MACSNTSCTQSPPCSDLEMQISIEDNIVVCHSVVVLSVALSNNDGTEIMDATKLKVFSTLGLAEEEVTFKTTELATTSGVTLVLSLCQGRNTFSFKFCCLAKDITIFYEPRNAYYVVVPLYVVLRGQSGILKPFRGTYGIGEVCARLSTIPLIVQALFSSLLKEIDCYGESFQLKHECYPHAKECAVFVAKLSLKEASNMTKNELRKRLGQEIMSATKGSSRKKFLAFLHLNAEHRRKMDEMDRDEETSVCGGNFALVITPEIDMLPRNASEIQERFIEEKHSLSKNLYSQPAGQLSTIVGTAAYELGHAFGLGHGTKGIMTKYYNGIGRKFFDINKDSLLAKNNLMFLKHNRWFIGIEEEITQFMLSYDDKMKIVRSSFGIRVLEIRSGPKENVEESWSFEEKITQFVIPKPYSHAVEQCIIVVEDDRGNIIKKIF